jgi:hypothetical protein
VNKQIEHLKKKLRLYKEALSLAATGEAQSLELSCPAPDDLCIHCTDDRSCHDVAILNYLDEAKSNLNQV